MATIKNIELVGISYHLPKKYINLKTLDSSFPEWNIKKIITKTGINKVFHSSENETALSLAIESSKKIISEFNIDKEKIESLIFVTQSPDYNLPTTACLLQDSLGINKNILAYDINLGCSGFVSALTTAASLINSEIVSNCLIVCSDTYSKYIKKDDRTNIPIFSDAASSCYLKKNGDYEIGPFKFGTDGSGAENLIVKGSGMKKIENNEESKLYMNGPQVMFFTLNEIPKALDQFFIENSLNKNDIDFFIFHQANHYVINNLIKKIKLDPSKVIFSSQNQGNTVSSTIPIAIKDMQLNNTPMKNKKVLLIGFGVGYSWSISMVKFA